MDAEQRTITFSLGGAVLLEYTNVKLRRFYPACTLSERSIIEMHVTEPRRPTNAANVPCSPYVRIHFNTSTLPHFHFVWDVDLLESLFCFSCFNYTSIPYFGTFPPNTSTVPNNEIEESVFVPRCELGTAPGCMHKWYCGRNLGHDRIWDGIGIHNSSPANVIQVCRIILTS